MPSPRPDRDDAGPPRAELKRVAGAALAGALAAGTAAAALGLGLELPGTPAALRGTAAGLRDFLNAGGWVRLPLWGAAFGALAALGWARAPRVRAAALGLAALALALAALPRPDLRDLVPAARGPRPAGVAAKSVAIRRGAYASPAGVRDILALRADPSPLIREQVALALGVNLIVSDIEHAPAGRPARFAGLPLRDSLRAGLLELLADSVEAVRAEAARALWKAPRTFGAVPAAAETLAAVLARAGRPEVPERLAWLALDAAAGAPDPALKRAAAEFAAVTADPDLRRAARLAAGAAAAP